jgi:hypothetical protein
MSQLVRAIQLAERQRHSPGRSLILSWRGRRCGGGSFRYADTLVRQVAVRPPSTMRPAPFMQPASSQARNRMPMAISHRHATARCPSRFAGPASRFRGTYQPYVDGPGSGHEHWGAHGHTDWVVPAFLFRLPGIPTLIPSTSVCPRAKPMTPSP